MLRSTKLISSLALALPVLSSETRDYPTLVTSDALQEKILLEDLLAGSQKLQDIAYANGGNRVFGSAGHNLTVDYIYDTLSALDYYNVIKQPFVEVYSGGTATLSAADVEYDPNVMTYSPAGTVSAALAVASNLGCAVEDFPADTEGKIAVILRGECPFAQKATSAKSAGAVGAIVYNNAAGTLSGTLGGVSDAYVPIVGITQEEGNTLIAAVAAGEVIADLVVDSTVENRTTFNVIAETKGGDHDNVLVLGAHSDSVLAGPGINDDGSGTIALLTVAKALASFGVTNAVRFGWWSAEEFGKLGSNAYVASVNTSEADIAKIRAYLNFDMIASPNYIYGIFDGDGNAFNVSGPSGSSDIEKTFEEIFTSKETPYIPIAFTGRTDYQAFFENGIPVGGLSTGADGVKTEEQAATFGGEVGVIYDPNYHQVTDTFENLAQEPYLFNTKVIAAALAKYATSFDSLPPVDLAKRRWAADRAQMMRRLDTGHAHVHTGPCAENLELA